MRRTTVIVLMLVLAAAIAIAAQGKLGNGRCGMSQNGGGQGMCAMNGGAGMGAGKGMCAMNGGAGMGMGARGWWNKVQPQTPQQKQFVTEIAALHDRIWSEKAELNAIKANNGDAKRATALETDIAALRTRVSELMTGNQALLKQMGINAPGKGMCGMAAKCAECTCKDKCCAVGGDCSQCPNKDTCPCYKACAAQGTGCATMCAQCTCPDKCCVAGGDCSQCPNKDTCPCCKACAAQGTGCAVQGACQTGAKAGCPTGGAGNAQPGSGCPLSN